MPISTVCIRLLAAGALLAPAAFGEEPSPPGDDLLSLTIDDLINIEVTSTSRQPERLIHATSAIEAVTSEDIRRYGAFNLTDALALSTGLNVARGDVRTWAITARGFSTNSANKMQVMMDGRLLFTPLYSGVFWDAQNTFIEDVDRIEIVRGPGAALWGSNAVNGVISVVSKDAIDTQGWLVSGGFGDFHESFARARYGDKLGDSTYFRVYGMTESDDALATLGGADGQDPRRLQQGGFRLDSYLDADNQLTIQGDLYEGRHGVPNDVDGKLSGANALARWTHIFDDRTDFALRFYFDRTSRLIPSTIREDRDTFDLDFQSTHDGDNGSKLVWGANLNYSTTDIENSDVLEFTPSDREMRSRSAFAQYQFFLSPENVGAVVGARIERNTLGGTDTQPNARLFWRATDKTTIWAAASRAARRPTQLDTDFALYGQNGDQLLVGNPSFDSEKVTAYELGYRSQLQDNLSLDLAAFHNEYTDLRNLEPDSDTFYPYRIENLLEAQSRGAEITINYQPTDFWTIQTGAVLLDLEFTPRAESSPLSVNAEGNDPEAWFHIRSSVALRHGWTVSANFRHTGALPAPAVPSHSDLDLHVAWEATENWELSIVGVDLLDPAHPEFGNQDADATQIPRQFFFKATWRH